MLNKIVSLVDLVFASDAHVVIMYTVHYLNQCNILYGLFFLRYINNGNLQLIAVFTIISYIGTKYRFLIIIIEYQMYLMKKQKQSMSQTFKLL